MPIDGRRPPNGRNFQSGAYKVEGQPVKWRQGDLEKSNAGLNIMRYPSELGTVQYPHFVMFYISVRTSDIGEKEQKAGFAPPGTVNFSSQNRFETSPGAIRVAEGALVLGAAEAGRKVVDSASDIMNKGGIPSEVTRKVEVGGFLAGAGVGVALTKRFEGGADRVTLKTAIALYMNNRPSTAYSANWQDTDLGVLGGAPGMLTNVKNVFTGTGADDITGGRLDAAKNVLTGLGGAAASLAVKNVNSGIAGEFGDAAGAFSAATGQAVNPFKAQLFKNMGFRTFSFDYVFLPKNLAEYEQVQNIIKTFKLYMHPTMSSDKFFMGYPAEFNIEYQYRENGYNENLYRISSCALTNMKVDYGGSDFMTFKGTGGAPAEISMSLAFTELELLTRARIEAGY